MRSRLTSTPASDREQTQPVVCGPWVSGKRSCARTTPGVRSTGWAGSPLTRTAPRPRSCVKHSTN
jgi:hypothetical protein